MKASFSLHDIFPFENETTPTAQKTLYEKSEAIIRPENPAKIAYRHSRAG
ncbi:MAG: hypothetical protein ABSE62_10105 [Chthoniobacteraceae bacterium]|jgi:hypothetical protein